MFILGNHQETGKLQQQAEDWQGDLGRGGGRGLEGCEAHHRGSLFPSIPSCSHTSPSAGLLPSLMPTLILRSMLRTEKIKDSLNPFSDPIQVGWTV